MTKVFVGNLPFSSTAADVRKLFEGCGKFSAELVTDKRTKRSKGIAFLKLESEEGVNQALQKDGVLFDGRILKVKKYRQKSKETYHDRQERLGEKICFGYPLNQQIYVGGIGFLDEHQITGMFIPFGEIAQVDIMRNRRTGEPKGYGFVIFQTAKAAKASLELNDTMFFGQKIKVSLARIKKKYPRGPIYQGSDSPSSMGTENSPVLNQWGPYPYMNYDHQGPNMPGYMEYPPMNEHYSRPDMPLHEGIMPMGGALPMPPAHHPYPLHDPMPTTLGTTPPPSEDMKKVPNDPYFMMGEKLGEPGYLMNQRPHDLTGLIAGFGNLQFPQGGFSNSPVPEQKRNRKFDRV